MKQITNSEIAKLISRDEAYVDRIEKEEKQYYETLKIGALCLLLELDGEDLVKMHQLKQNEIGRIAELV